MNDEGVTSEATKAKDNGENGNEPYSVISTLDRIRRPGDARPEDQEKAVKQRCRFSRWMRRNRDGIAFFETISTIALAGLMVAVTWQIASDNTDLVKATSDANKIARAAVEIDQRPWVSIRLLELGPLTNAGHERRADMKIEVTNFGKSPAISLWLDGRFAPSRGELSQKIGEFKDPANNPRFGRPFGQHIMFPGESEILEYNALALETEIEQSIILNPSPQRFFSLHLFIGVAYWSAQSDEMLFTYRTYSVGAVSDGPGLMSLRADRDNQPLTALPNTFEAK